MTTNKTINEANEANETTVTSAMIEAAARVLARSEEANENKWPKYAETTEEMLRAALAVS